MSFDDLLPLANHLWQSTLFVAAVWLVTLMLRKNRAAVRHRLWLAASVKFLIPFSLLVGIGSHFQWRTAPAAAPRAISIVVAEPFGGVRLPSPETSRLPGVCVLVWMLGSAANIAWWFIGWWRLRRASHTAAPLSLEIPIPARSCPERLEPGVFGVFKPVLLLPAGIMDLLSPDEFKTVLSHELYHVRRRDNLTSAIHLFVEALFWFHPLVWWIKSRLIAEQERACDEEVIRIGNDPHVYAQSILKLCEFYLTSPLICAAGMTGSNLKERIREIMGNQARHKLTFTRKLMLLSAAIAVPAAPILVGALTARPLSVVTQLEQPAHSQVLQQQPRAPLPQSADPGAAFVRALGEVMPSSTVRVKPRIDGQLISAGFTEGGMVQAGQLLATIDTRPYELQLIQAEIQLTADQLQLAEAKSRQNSAVIAQLESRVRADQASADSAKLQTSYGEIRSPITGLAGLRLTDPGNVVRAADAIVVITQLQPIAVVFSIPEDYISSVLPLLRNGTNIIAEAWDRGDATKLATGRVSAVDNQIDVNSGTLKVKAVFDNKDSALFPNQFVVVHMLVR